MAYPSKTNANEIISVAIDLIQNEGEEALTVARLASKVGIKAPSLYKHFSGRDEIIQHVERRLFAMLGEELRGSIRSDMETTSSLLSACIAYRAFAKRHARLYPLLFSQSRLRNDEAADVRARSAGPVIELFQGDIPSVALNKARTITAYVHGFVTIEIANGFQLGGDMDSAFEYGAKTIIQAILKN